VLVYRDMYVRTFMKMCDVCGRVYSVLITSINECVMNAQRVLWWSGTE
jgi:hypothetical protein